MIRGAVLGGDVSKSRSPAIHNTAFRLLGQTGTYEAISVDARGFAKLVNRLAAHGYRYVNVTIPHKRAAAKIAGSRSPLVRATGAANTLIFGRNRRDAASIKAENTDGYGLLAALADLGLHDVRGQTVVMVGAGGAAAGALAALVAAGACVRIVARRLSAARALRARFSPSLRAHIAAISWTPGGLAAALHGASVLISAVPASAWESAEARAGLATFARHAAVVEMAYGAAPSALARLARTHVARYQDGIPMLAHQAARAIELALGQKPPTTPLIRAARRARPAGR